MRRLLLFLIFSSLFLFTPLTPLASATTVTNTDIQGNYYMGWDNGLETVVQEITFDQNLTLDTIKIPIGTQGKPGAELEVSFGLITKTSYPFVETPLAKTQTKTDGELTLSVARKLSPGKYGIVFHVYIYDFVNLWYQLNHDMNPGTSGSQVPRWYYVIPYGANIFPGSSISYAKNIHYLPYSLPTTTTTQDNDIALTMVYYPEGNGGLGWPFANDQPHITADTMTVLTILGVAAIGGYVILKRRK